MRNTVEKITPTQVVRVAWAEQYPPVDQAASRAGYAAHHRIANRIKNSVLPTFPGFEDTVPLPPQNSVAIETTRWRHIVNGLLLLADIDILLGKKVVVEVKPRKTKTYLAQLVLNCIAATKQDEAPPMGILYSYEPDEPMYALEQGGQQLWPQAMATSVLAHTLQSIQHKIDTLRQQGQMNKKSINGQGILPGFEMDTKNWEEEIQALSNEAIELRRNEFDPLFEGLAKDATALCNQIG